MILDSEVYRNKRINNAAMMEEKVWNLEAVKLVRIMEAKVTAKGGTSKSDCIDFGSSLFEKRNVVHFLCREPGVYP